MQLDLWQREAAHRLATQLMLVSGGCDFTPGISKVGARRIVDALRRNKKPSPPPPPPPLECGGSGEGNGVRRRSSDGDATASTAAAAAAAATELGVVAIRRKTPCRGGSDGFNAEAVDALTLQCFGDATGGTKGILGEGETTTTTTTTTVAARVARRSSLLSFPWRFRRHLCAATVDVQQLGLYVRRTHARFKSKGTNGLSRGAAEAEARRLVYSVMVLSAGAGCPEALLGEGNARATALARRFGYDPEDGFAFLRGNRSSSSCCCSSSDAEAKDDQKRGGSSVNVAAKGGGGGPKKKKKKKAKAETTKESPPSSSGSSSSFGSCEMAAATAAALPTRSSATDPPGRAEKRRQRRRRRRRQRERKRERIETAGAVPATTRTVAVAAVFTDGETSDSDAPASDSILSPPQ